MKEVNVTITNATGLHARPAAMFVQKAGGFKSKVKLAGNGKVADAKSILAVMGMGLAKGTVLTISAEGEDEAACVQALKELIESNFGEG
jgi:phosphocarrier protein